VQDGQEDRSLDVELEATAVEELLDDPLAPRWKWARKRDPPEGKIGA
jgi:hypothetical protein